MQRTKETGHPAGLWVLFTTEMWERFAFYAMRAILVLYLVSVSTNEYTPGFGWTESDAYRLYGLYTGLVYLVPLFGGWVADRFLGQARCVVLGGMLMAVGEFFLAATEFVRIGIGVPITLKTDPVALWTFYVGLALMILGNGFFKPCISVMVGQLYKPDDHLRRDAAFSIFYMGINIGAFFSPLVAGTVAEKFGYHLGFIIAGIGMILGVISFTLFRTLYLRGIGLPPKPPTDQATLTPEEVLAHEKAEYERTRPLVKADHDRMFVILVLSVFVIAFWVSFEQAGSSLNTFAKSRTNRNVDEKIALKTPAFIAGQFLVDEYVQDFSSAVNEVEAIEQNILAILQPEKKEASDDTKAVAAKKETFAERCRRLFSFRSSSDAVGATSEEQIALNNIRAAKRPDDPLFVQNLLDLCGRTLTAEKRKELFAQLGMYREKLEEMEKQTSKSQSLYVPGKQISTFPATWYQSVNAFGIVIFAPIFTILWYFLARRGVEPSTPMKFALGLLLLSVGFFLMIPGAIESHRSGGNAAAHWLIWCYLFSTWGELCLSPVGLSMVTKLAPARYASMFMGIWFLASSAAYFLAGELAAMFGSGEGVTILFGKENGLADFFLLMGLIPAAIGLLALAMAPTLKKMMHGIN